MRLTLMVVLLCLSGSCSRTTLRSGGALPDEDSDSSPIDDTQGDSDADGDADSDTAGDTQGETDSDEDSDSADSDSTDSDSTDSDSTDSDSEDSDSDTFYGDPTPVQKRGQPDRRIWRCLICEE